jgi:hypothetical protein
VCKRCEEIGASISRYRCVLAVVKDEAVIIMVKGFVANLESEKDGLHPVDAVPGTIPP